MSRPNQTGRHTGACTMVFAGSPRPDEKAAVAHNWPTGLEFKCMSSGLNDYETWPFSGVEDLALNAWVIWVLLFIRCAFFFRILLNINLFFRHFLLVFLWDLCPVSLSWPKMINSLKESEFLARADWCYSRMKSKFVLLWVVFSATLYKTCNTSNVTFHFTKMVKIAFFVCVKLNVEDILKPCSKVSK